MTATPNADRAVEFAFQAIAHAIDRVGPDRTELFLARLTLILSNEIGDRATIERCIERALAGLPQRQAGDGKTGG